ncbi:MAG: hypothetical protein K9J37_13695 [Saprospiraceae bacterium]|nr:hypothetical protein [Saprospiraceae bacterium]MCF8250963.1 hypothetical protein [Saprospiraceae bacterium]MCF8281940.1 hypothetical protein [Bacteroidales bacterium]MCF8311927.1 hypothetical protein [Saprospiraceae bacterium]MCF8441935.1 hypothetical protein [Saprospiraceae bacterium]
MTKREQLISKAYTLLSTPGNNLVNASGKIPSTTKGYIASLGGSIVQAGLKQSVIFFEASKEGREHIIKALVKLIKQQWPDRYSFDENKFGKQLATQTWDRYQLTTDFVEAAVALKMAMRLYPS